VVLLELLIYDKLLDVLEKPLPVVNSPLGKSVVLYLLNLIRLVNIYIETFLMNIVSLLFFAGRLFNLHAVIIRVLITKQKRANGDASVSLYNCVFYRLVP